MCQQAPRKRLKELSITEKIIQACNSGRIPAIVIERDRYPEKEFGYKCVQCISSFVSTIFPSIINEY